MYLLCVHFILLAFTIQVGTDYGRMIFVLKVLFSFLNMHIICFFLVIPIIEMVGNLL